MIDEELKNRFYNNPIISSLKPKIEEDVLLGEITPTNAVTLLLSKYFDNI